MAEWMVRLERCARGTRNEEQDARTRRTGWHLQPASERCLGTRHNTAVPSPR
jgi:hypothetical protein